MRNQIEVRRDRNTAHLEAEIVARAAEKGWSRPVWSRLYVASKPPFYLERLAIFQNGRAVRVAHACLGGGIRWQAVQDKDDWQPVVRIEPVATVVRSVARKVRKRVCRK